MKALVGFSALALILAGFVTPVQAETPTTTSIGAGSFSNGTLTLTGANVINVGSGDTNGGINTILLAPDVASSSGLGGAIKSGTGTLTLGGGLIDSVIPNIGVGGLGNVVAGPGSALSIGGNQIVLPNGLSGGLHIVGPGSQLNGGINNVVVHQNGNAIPDSGSSILLMGIAILGLIALGSRRETLAR